MKCTLAFLCALLLASPAWSQTIRVSVATGGAEASAPQVLGGVRTPVSRPSVSADGSVFAFGSKLRGLVNLGNEPRCGFISRSNTCEQVYVHDTRTGTTELVSRSASGGFPATLVLGSVDPTISADGRYIAYASPAWDIAGPTPVCLPGSGGFIVHCTQVYLFDRQTGQTTRVTTGVDGQPGNGFSSAPAISADGRYVAFSSDASNLVTFDVNQRSDVFVWDRLTGVITIESSPAPGVPAIGGAGQPAISADGRYVAFTSNAGNLLTDDTNSSPYCERGGTTNCPDVFLRDRTTGALSRVSVGAAGEQLALGGTAPRISGDGRYVAFLATLGTDPVPTPLATLTNHAVMVFDRLTGAATRVGAGEVLGFVSFAAATALDLSDDGRIVAFVSSQDDLVPGDTNGAADAFVHDRQLGVTFRASVDSAGAQSQGLVLQLGLSGDGRTLVFNSDATDLVPGDTNAAVDAFAANVFDPDGDTAPTAWETVFGLDPFDAADGAADPDSDGATNAQEAAALTHPRGLASATRYFAEGVTGAFFETGFELLNPGTDLATVLLRFLKADGSSAVMAVDVPGRQQRVIAADRAYGLVGQEFATVIESDAPVVADRTLDWQDAAGYGSHAERSQAGPALTWYLAEGATHSGFDLFYLLVNPQNTAAQVRVRYLLPAGPPIERTYTVAPRSRFTIWVDQESFGGVLRLAATDVSGVLEVQNGVPVLVERAMYLTPPGGPLFSAGHASAGVTAPSTSWFLAEGATGSYFDEFVLVANPSGASALVRATFLLDSGVTYTKEYSVAASTRRTIWVDEETLPGAGKALADAALSIRLDVVTGPPVIVERSMWWPGPTAATWMEAHNAVAATSTAPRWGFAAGEVDGGPATSDTYFLLANPTPTPAAVKVTLLFADGTAEISRSFTVLPTSRFNVDVRAHFPGAVGRTFGALVESQGVSPVPLVVERAMYRDALGLRWAAGSVALGTPLP